MSYPVTLAIEYPEKLSRLTTFFRFPVFPTFSSSAGGNASQWRYDWSFGTGFPMALPHTIILIFIGIAAGVILLLAWFAILFTGRYPETFFKFITWYFRWDIRVNSYAVLVTDKYPPFSGIENPL